jgi:hypothetical protein
MRLLMTALYLSLHLSIRQNLISHFMLIWFLFLVIAVLYGIWIGGRYTPLAPAQRNVPAQPRQWRLSVGDRINVLLFLLFAALYIFVILYKEDFAYYDDDMMTDFPLRGLPALVPIWPETGRFFPLAYRGFNVVRHLTSSPAGYHASVVIELVAVLAVVFLSLKNVRLQYRLLVLAAIMLAPSFIIPFSGFVYPERSVLLWLSVLLLCLLPSSQASAPRASAIGALVATQFVLYYKETAVVFIVAYAGSSILLESSSPWRQENSWQKIARAQAVQLGMLGLAATYSMMFLAILSSGPKLSYVAALKQSLASTVFAYFQCDWLLAIFLVVTAVRVVRILSHGARLVPLWDSLAIGAASYYLAIICLRIYSPYYMAPADFIALLYVARLAVIALQQNREIVSYAVAAVFLCFVVHRAVYSSFHMLERKDIITAKRQLSDFMKHYLADGNQGTIELYFPYASGYRLMELSSYFRYKGLPLAGQQKKGVVPQPGIVIVGREHFENNRCVPYRDYVCLHSDHAPPGALIVLMPDDDVSLEDVEAVGKDNIHLWSAKQCSFCSGENPWLRALQGISATHASGPIPSHWLLLDVFKKPTDKEAAGRQLAASRTAVL